MSTTDKEEPRFASVQIWEPALRSQAKVRWQ